MSIGNRLRKLREKAGLTQQDIAEKLSVSVQAVSNWEQGKNNPTAEKLLALLDFVARTEQRRAVEGAVEGEPQAESLLDAYKRMAAVIEEQDRDGDIVRIPIDEMGDYVQPAAVPRGAIGEIDTRASLGAGNEVQLAYVSKAGEAVATDAYKQEFWNVPRDFVREELRAPVAQVIVVPTVGDSMAPTIETNERVFVDTGHTRPSPDGIYCIRDDFGGLVVKRLQVEGSEVIVISDNPRHPSRRRRLDEIHIVGKVVAGIKRY